MSDHIQICEQVIFEIKYACSVRFWLDRPCLSVATENSLLDTRHHVGNNVLEMITSKSYCNIELVMISYKVYIRQYYFNY